MFALALKGAADRDIPRKSEKMKIGLQACLQAFISIPPF
jgi:hypothetical protein